jgi:hypothetical protein
MLEPDKVATLYELLPTMGGVVYDETTGGAT